MSVRVLIADDHEVVRSGIRALLSGTEFDVVAEAASGEEAYQRVCELKPDLVLLDVRMPDGDGLAAMSRIKSQLPEQRVLVLSTYDNPTYVARAMALGAS